MHYDLMYKTRLSRTFLCCSPGFFLGESAARATLVIFLDSLSSEPSEIDTNLLDAHANILSAGVAEIQLFAKIYCRNHLQHLYSVL